MERHRSAHNTNYPTERRVPTIARRGKKTFLSEHYKEIEKNNRMGKTKISSRKLEISREYFMQGWAIKDRNSKDLIEVEEIKKRWQEYTEEQHKKTS